MRIVTNIAIDGCAGQVDITTDELIHKFRFQSSIGRIGINNFTHKFVANDARKVHVSPSDFQVSIALFISFFFVSGEEQIFKKEAQEILL